MAALPAQERETGLLQAAIAIMAAEHPMGKAR